MNLLNKRFLQLRVWPYTNISLAFAVGVPNCWKNISRDCLR